MREANVPAEEPPASEAARLSAPNVDSGRAGHRAVAPSEGPAPLVGLIQSIGDRTAFAALGRSPRRVRRGPITVTYAAGPFPDHVRVAYAIGRRVGGAVRRNRLRRRLRAVMSEQSGNLRPGAYLVGAGPEATSLSFGELRECVAQALEDQRLLTSATEDDRTCQ